MQKEEFYFGSRDGKSQIHAVRYTPDGGEIVGVLQIIHGMAEYVERYERFAEFMTGKGFVVTGEDHLGHGKSVTGDGNYGYFCEQDPATVIVRDAHRLKKMTQELYPGKPYVILGHSMGSLIFRNYLCKYSKGIQAAIIMGTTHLPLPKLMASKAMCATANTLYGPYHVAANLDKIAFGSYNKAIADTRTNFDWLTRDEAEVDKYIADPLCGFTFTVNGFQTLMELSIRLHKPVNLAKVRDSLPILIVSGEEDPVGEYGKAPGLVEKSLKEAGVQDISVKVYPGDRHELLNEINYMEVQEDLLQWILSKLAPAETAK